MRTLHKVISALALVASAAVSNAQSGFAFRKTDIKAVYLHLPGDHLSLGAGLSLAAPHVWFNLDNNSAVKPAGWNFVNPLAAGRLETDELPFFASRFTNTPAAGFATSKADVRYWWQNVRDLSDDDLGNIDVALIQVTTPNLPVAPSDREKIRRFVDKGGVLWVDLTYGFFNQTNGGPIPFFATIPGSPDSNLQWDPQSPLLNFPNNLTDQEIQSIGFGPTYSVQPINKRNLDQVNLGAEGANTIGNLVSSMLGFSGEYGLLKPVVAAAGLPSISVARIGDGYMVVSTRGLSEAINRVGNNLNREYFGVQPAVQSGSTVASSFSNAVSKFIINIISLATQSTQTGGGTRKNSSTFIDQGAPMLQTWNGSFPPTSSATLRSAKPPVIYKGLVFIATDNQVFAYDSDPNSDQDNDGNPDDGIVDLNLGDEEDRLFATAPAGAVISGVVAAEVPNPGPGVPQDQLLVTTADGRLLVYPIYDNNRRILATATVAPIANLTAGAGGSPVAVAGEPPREPTVHEGIAYVADTVQSGASQEVGRLWMVNLRSLQVVRSASPGSNPFIFGGTASNPPRFSSAPTIGYIPVLDNSNALDKVAYVPLMPQASPQSNSGVVSLWIGAKGEKPSSVVNNGGSIDVVTRAGTRNLPAYIGTSAGDALSPKISIIRANGVPFTAAEVAAVFDGSITQNQGTITLGLVTGATWPPTGVDTDGVRVDYNIDWGAAFPSATASIERGRLFFPTSLQGQKWVVGGIALSPSGTMYVTNSTKQINPLFNPGGGADTGQNVGTIDQNVNTYLGSFFAIREEGRGLFRMVYRWDLYPQHTMNFQGGSQLVPSAIPDNDPLQYLQFGAFNLGFILGGPFRTASFQGAPVIRNNEVYVTVSGIKNLAPATAVLCFKDDSSSREIRIGSAVGPSTVIVQPDISRSANPTAPTVLSSLGEGEYRVERERGEVGAIIRLDNLMRGNSGQIVDSINTSQPIILRSQGRPDQVIDPATQGDRWNPLKWYTVLHGTATYSSAFASGNTLYVAGMSYLPSVLENLTNGIPSPIGFISAVRTDFDPSVAVRTSQGFSTNPLNFQPREVIADNNRPYMRQLITMDYPRANANWTSPQIPTPPGVFPDIFPNTNYVWPQAPRNLEERGRITFDDFRIRVNQCALRGNSTFVDGGGVTQFNRPLGVVGGDNTVLTWTNTNLFAFKKADFWVADEGRISLFDPSGNVIYNSKTNTSFGSTAGFTAGGKQSNFGRPTRIYPIPNTSDILVVDSDQNRIVRMAPSGSVSRELTQFVVDPAFAPGGYAPGEPLSFQNPRDCLTYTSEVLQANNRFSNAQPLERWRHYLVADQGNNRIIEIVDRYAMNPTTGQITGLLAEGSLLWHSPSQVSGKGYQYNSLSRIQTGAASFMVVAGVGNKAPTRRDTGEPNVNGSFVGDQNSNDARSSQTGNGGVVIFDATIPGGYRVFDRFQRPQVDNTRIFDFVTGTWSTDITRSVIAGNQTFNNLQSVTAQQLPGGVLTLMVADANGVFELQTTVVNPVGLATRWMLPNYAMVALRRAGANGGFPTSSNPARFFPTYARRLNDEEVIIVNGYQGRNVFNTGDYSGEVLQIDGRIDFAAQSSASLMPIAYVPNGYSTNTINLGFNIRSVKLRFGPIEGARGLVLPVFADRR
jgi:hypothetical protein